MKPTPHFVEYSTAQVSHALGVSPMTADRIAGLLNGRINPENYRSVGQEWPLAEFAIREPVKTLTAVAKIMGWQAPQVHPDYQYLHVNSGDPSLPAVIWKDGEYSLISLNEYRGRAKSA